MPKKLIYSTEDDPPLQNLLEDILTVAGYEVCFVPATALAVTVAREPPALVLLDLLTPGMCGTMAAEEVRKTAVPAQVPIVVLTAFGKQGEQYATFGAQDVVAKPFNIETLLAAVTRWAVPGEPEKE